MIATVALVGGGGATLGAKMPLDLPLGGKSAVEKRIAEAQAEAAQPDADAPGGEAGAPTELMLPVVSKDPPTFESPAGPPPSEPPAVAADLVPEPPSAGQPSSDPPPSEPPAPAEPGPREWGRSRRVPRTMAASRSPRARYRWSRIP